MKDRLSSFDALEQRLGKLEARGSQPPPPQVGKSSPQMFDAQLGALGAERLQHLQSLAGRGPAKLGDLGSGVKEQAAFPLNAQRPLQPDGTLEEEEIRKT